MLSEASRSNFVFSSRASGAFTSAVCFFCFFFSPNHRWKNCRLLHFSSVLVPLHITLFKSVADLVKWSKTQQHKSRENTHIPHWLHVSWNCSSIGQNQPEGKIPTKLPEVNKERRKRQQVTLRFYGWGSLKTGGSSNSWLWSCWDQDHLQSSLEESTSRRWFWPMWTRPAGHICPSEAASRGENGLLCYDTTELNEAGCESPLELTSSSSADPRVNQTAYMQIKLSITLPISPHREGSFQMKRPNKPDFNGLIFFFSFFHPQKDQFTVWRVDLAPLVIITAVFSCSARRRTASFKQLKNSWVQHLHYYCPYFFFFFRFPIMFFFLSCVETNTNLLSFVFLWSDNICLLCAQNGVPLEDNKDRPNQDHIIKTAKQKINEQN